MVRHFGGIYFKHVLKTICRDVLPELRMELKLLGFLHVLMRFPTSSPKWVSSEPAAPWGKAQIPLGQRRQEILQSLIFST